ncbi:MAG: coproporphyrinogen-III oxidase family protein [Kiritimatiellia bacterium]
MHFPFCRRKCTYCVLPSRAGVSPYDRKTYVRRLADTIRAEVDTAALSTIYFGGGSPGLCDLTPFGDVLNVQPSTEFTVELNPLDVTREKLTDLKRIGVNRISMGVQSLDDDILRHMGRGYTFPEAERAFYLIKEYFDNAGIDLIVGYPGETSALSPRHARLAKWGLRHCSVYSLILEEGSILAHQIGHPPGTVPGKAGAVPTLPDDDTVLNRLAIIARFLRELGLERYEISNYSVPGCECRHNLATWCGEDYLGFGEGACGRIGRTRTRNYWGQTPNRWGQSPEIETLSEEKDAIERKIFALRTRYGLDVTNHPQWGRSLDPFVAEGLLEKAGSLYRLTERGTEVCDTILAELV